MGLSERNKHNAISRWKKYHSKQLEYLNKSHNQNHLKARILGFIAGDGNVYAKDAHHYIRCFPDHKSLISPLVQAFEQVYGIKPIIKILNNHFMVRVYSKIIVNDILSQGVFGTYRWRLPSNLVDLLSKKEWLKAFFDAEATVQKKYIRIGSVNDIGLAQVQELLKEFNINSKVYEYVPKNLKWNKNYLLTIDSKEDKTIYFNQIGFNHKLKSQKLAAQIQTAGVA